MNTNERTIRIFAKEVSKDKQKFITCSTIIGEQWYKVKFTKDCEEYPKERGVYYLTVDLLNVSVESAKSVVNKDGKKVMTNPTLWIRKTTRLQKLTDEELNEENVEKLKEIFDV